MTSNSTTDTDSNDDRIELQSPYRPLPLGAKKDLRKVDECVEFDDENPRVAYTHEIPPDELLSEWELTVIRTDEPNEIWETDRGDYVEIYDDRVEHDGREVTLSPAEAKEKVREQSHFTRVDTPEN